MTGLLRGRRRRLAWVAVTASIAAGGGWVHAESEAAASDECPRCAEWTVSQKPFRVYGNTYYVGTRELGAILITSDAGHVLIDGAVREATPQLIGNIRALGFKVEDIHLILNSHAHFDHAGGIAAIQRLSGAEVAAGPSSAKVLTQGRSGPDDPQFASLLRGPDPVAHVRVISDGEVLAVGKLRFTAHFTPGHTVGGTSGTWMSCELSRCVSSVYADSLSAVSAPAFRFTDNTTYPSVLADFARSFTILNSLPCDILLTPHPEASDALVRLRRRADGFDPSAFIDPGACRSYAERSRSGLEE